MQELKIIRHSSHSPNFALNSNFGNFRTETTVQIEKMTDTQTSKQIGREIKSKIHKYTYECDIAMMHFWKGNLQKRIIMIEYSFIDSSAIKSFIGYR